MPYAASQDAQGAFGHPRATDGSQRNLDGATRAWRTAVDDPTTQWQITSAWEGRPEDRRTIRRHRQMRAAHSTLTRQFGSVQPLQVVFSQANFRPKRTSPIESTTLPQKLTT